MKAYFARPITQFNTTQDRIDIHIIEKAGFDVIEITDDGTQENYRTYGMDYFKEIINLADALFFSSFDDGAIGAGVAKEIGWADKREIPIFEMPNNVSGRTLSVEDTRARINELT